MIAYVYLDLDLTIGLKTKQQQQHQDPVVQIQALVPATVLVPEPSTSPLIEPSEASLASESNGRVPYSSVAIFSETDFKCVQGHFDNDPFEPLRIFVEKATQILYVRLGHVNECTVNGKLAPGEGFGDISFDLKRNTFITFPCDDVTAFRLKNNGMDITFKVSSDLFDAGYIIMMTTAISLIVVICMMLTVDFRYVNNQTESISQLQSIITNCAASVLQAPPKDICSSSTLAADNERLGRSSSIAGEGGGVARKKYTSVEDILEGTATAIEDDVMLTAGANPQHDSVAIGGTAPHPALPPPPTIDVVYMPPPPVSSSAKSLSTSRGRGDSADPQSSFVSYRRLLEDGTEVVGGHVRKELIDSHIKRPKYSVRHVQQLVNWLNALNIWQSKIEIVTLHKHMCSGILLARLVQRLIPGTQFRRLNDKPLSRAPAMENLEQALGVVWRAKSVNNSRIASASDIYAGNTPRIAVMLQELFEVYVQRPLYKSAIKMLKWFDHDLRQYGRALPAEIFSEGDLSGLWRHFQSGTALFCSFYHYFGPIAVGEGANIVRIDPMHICIR